MRIPSILINAHFRLKVRTARVDWTSLDSTIAAAKICTGDFITSQNFDTMHSATPKRTNRTPRYVVLEGDSSPIRRPAIEVTRKVREFVIGTASEMSA